MISRARDTWGLWAAGAIGLIAYLGLVRLDAQVGTLRDEFTPQTIWWYLLAFVGFLLGLWWNERRPIPLVWLWAIPIVFRLLLLTTTPTLSDDVYRYIWDGNVSTAGINPYAHTLDASALDTLDISARQLANNPSLGTPYLPVAQLAFAVTAQVAPPEPLPLQVLMVVFDLAAAGTIVLLLKSTKLPQHRVMLYLWNPLVVVEVAHGAHLDSMMIMLAMLSVYLTLTKQLPKRGWMAPLLLALATLTRPLPLLILPVLWPRWRGSQRLVYITTISAVLVPFGWTAGWGLTGEFSGAGLFGSARIYSAWTFNSALYQSLTAWLNSRGVPDAGQTTRLIVIALMLAVLVIVWRRSRRPITPLEALRLMALPVMAYVILTPTLNPWYLLLLVAFLPFIGSGNRPRRWLAISPWLYLSGAIVISYLTFLDPLNHAEIAWVRKVEWYPTLVLLAAHWGTILYQARRRQTGPSNDVGAPQGASTSART